MHVHITFSFLIKVDDKQFYMHTTVTQSKVKPSGVLQWPKIATLLGFSPRPHLVGLQCPLHVLRDTIL